MSITAAKGYRAAGIHAGTKAPGVLDLALLVSDEQASVAGAFTTNKAECAHIQVCKPRIAEGRARGVLVSAGIADAATGAAGIEHAASLARAASEACGVAESEMLVCLTGRIGPKLPIEDLLPKVADAAAVLSREGHTDAARAIWTTDTVVKESVRTIEVDGATVTIGGMAKGAAMIAPQMRVHHATMLAFLTTDARASAETLRQAVDAALPTTFNAIVVDGSRSTNDTVLLFANGASGVKVEPSGAFATAVREVMADLAYAIAQDGEGSTKTIRMRVVGAASRADAEAAARELASSILLRSAIWAREAKWGWVIQQIGQADIAFDQERVNVDIGGIRLAEEGIGTGRDAEARAALDADEVTVEADLGLGSGAFEIITCDITPEFPRMQLGT